MDNSNVDVILSTDLHKRKEMLHKVAKTEKSWKIRICLSIVLFVLSISLLIATGFLLLSCPTDTTGMFLFIGTGIIFACVPFFIALSVKNKAKYICAYPYSSYANGKLILGENSLQYIFWQVGPTEPAAYSSPRAVFHEEDKFIYQINKEDISKINIDKNGICTIFGSGNIILPKWAEIPKSEIKELSKEFSFLICFSEDSAKDIIQNWKNRK